MVTEYPTTLSQLTENLERLDSHVRAVRAGSKGARDDLAVSLHILVGDGPGHGLIQNACEEVGIAPPRVPGWSDPMPEMLPSARYPSPIGRLPGPPDMFIPGSVVLALRAATPQDGDAVLLRFEEFLDQTCLRFAEYGVAGHANWSVRDLVKRVRDKFGSHADRKPPIWLRDLRVYPVASSDAITFLLWSIAEAVSRATRLALRHAGIDLEDLEECNPYLRGVDLRAAYAYVLPGDKIALKS